MGFVARAFTPSSGPPPGSAANPLPLPPGSQTTPSGQIVLPSQQSQSGVAQAPIPPSTPAAPPSPPQFAPGAAPAAARRAAGTASTLLGSAATAQQLAGGAQQRRTVLG